LYEL